MQQPWASQSSWIVMVPCCCAPLIPYGQSKQQSQQLQHWNPTAFLHVQFLRFPVIKGSEQPTSYHPELQPGAIAAVPGRGHQHRSRNTPQQPAPSLHPVTEPQNLKPGTSPQCLLCHQTHAKHRGQHRAVTAPCSHLPALRRSHINPCCSALGPVPTAPPRAQYLDLGVASVQQPDGKQDALLEDLLVLGVHDEVSHQLGGPFSVQPALDGSNSGPVLVSSCTRGHGWM